LNRFADVASDTVGADVRNVPGAGAAGGVGAGFLSLAHAMLRPGAQLVLELLEFERHLAHADLAVTGEGLLDRQTSSGKAPFAVAQAAKGHHIPVAAIAGSVECPPAELEAAGILLALSIVSGPMSIEEAMQKSTELVQNAAEGLGRALKMGATFQGKIT
jgi:glycerate kinase